MSVSFTLAGAKFRPAAARALIADLPLNDSDNSITLEPEPTNAYDPDAIQVLVDEVHIGYVPKNITDEVHLLINAGFMIEVTGFQSDLQPTFLVYEPADDNEDGDD